MRYSHFKHKQFFYRFHTFQLSCHSRHFQSVYLQSQLLVSCLKATRKIFVRLCVHNLITKPIGRLVQMIDTFMSNLTWFMRSWIVSIIVSTVIQFKWKRVATFPSQLFRSQINLKTLFKRFLWINWTARRRQKSF